MEPAEFILRNKSQSYKMNLWFQIISFNFMAINWHLLHEFFQRCDTRINIVGFQL